MQQEGGICMEQAIIAVPGRAEAGVTDATVNDLQPVRQSRG
jgi:hypothetical protein